VGDKTLEFDPRHPHAREFLGGAYLKQGDFERYMAENIKHAKLHGVPAEALGPLKRAYAGGGAAGVRAITLQHLSSQPQGMVSRNGPRSFESVCGEQTKLTRATAPTPHINPAM
jgi:hypothetical protein